MWGDLVSGPARRMGWLRGSGGKAVKSSLTLEVSYLSRVLILDHLIIQLSDEPTTMGIYLT